MSYTLALAALVSYLSGSIPTSYIVGRVFRGIDLREHGSGNLGGSNVYRVMGLRFALPVAIVDVAKGAIPTGVLGPMVSDNVAVWVGLGMIAVLGHIFSIWLRFQGGKGAATATGVILALAPKAVLAILLLWLAIARMTGTASIATIASAAVAPGLVYVLYPSNPEMAGLILVLAIGVIVAHRSNIIRLATGRENRLRGAKPDHSNDTSKE